MAFPPFHRAPQASAQPSPPPGTWAYQPPPPPPPWWWRLLRAMMGSMSGGLVILGMILGIGLWRSGEEFVQGVRDLFVPPPPEDVIDVPTVVVQQVRGASELTTAVFTMETVVPTSSIRTWGQYELGRTTLIYVAYGEVRAGVDLAQLTPTDVRVEEGILRVSLPPPQLLDGKIDVGRSRVYDYDRGFLGLGPDRAPELQSQAQTAALTHVVEVACREGILQEASDRAELTVAQLLQPLGMEQTFTQIEVISRPATDCALPATTPEATPRLGLQ